MNEIELIVETLRQTFDGRAWHGPSFTDVLNGVDKTQAIERPIKARHTIWEIVNHCTFWMEAVTRALHSESMPDIESTEDWSKMGKTDEDWTNAQEKLKKAYEELVNSTKNLNEAQLTQKIHGSYDGQPYATAYRRMLHGISDHNTYHAGQIALLRKKTP
ncbi:MAG: DinB family protein [Candidatus Bathyarchaeota archaeon]|nr:DinB family protein [Candidatus Bathyarchaeota archaeon]